MVIESVPALVSKDIASVYSFLTNIQHLKFLLPEDKISDWNADEYSCSFKIQGGIIIPLVMKEQLPFNQIQMVSGVKSPFPFTLTVFLEEEGSNTRGKLVFDAKVGKTIQLIAQKPLRNLFDSMSQRLAKHFEQ